MNFRRNKDDGRRRRLFILASLSVICLFIVLVPSVRDAASSVALFFARPAWSAAVGIGDAASNVAAYFSSKATLQRENTRLLEALYATANESRTAELLRLENAELKAMLERDLSGRKLILAVVLAQPPTTAFDTLIIDIGETNGIERGMRVFVDGAFAIGEVVETRSRSALVSLYSSSGYEIDGFIGASSTPAIFHGAGGGSFRASVPKGAGISIADPVVLPSIHPTFAALVSGIDAPEGSSLATVHATLPVNFAHLSHVYVEFSQE